MKKEKTELITVSEAAKLLGITPSGLRVCIFRGTLQSLYGLDYAAGGGRGKAAMFRRDDVIAAAKKVARDDAKVGQVMGRGLWSSVRTARELGMRYERFRYLWRRCILQTRFGLQAAEIQVKNNRRILWFSRGDVLSLKSKNYTF